MKMQDFRGARGRGRYRARERAARELHPGTGRSGFGVTDVTGWIGIPLVPVSLLGTGIVSSWLVPALIFVVVIVANWLGLRWIRSEHLEELASVPLFSGLSKRELLTVLRSARAVSFLPGMNIIEEGDVGTGFYSITQGNAKVSVDGAELATLASGSYLGEVAVIDGGPWTATITAVTPVSTLELTPSAFLRLVDRKPTIAQGIFAELCRRLRATGDPVDCDDDSPLDRARLVELCERLRARTEHPEWAQAKSPRKRWLRLSGLFARGS